LKEKILGMLSIQTNKILIDGEWATSSSGDVFQVVNPATSEPISQVPRCSPEDVKRAIDAAKRASKIMARMPVGVRAQLLEKAGQIANSRSEELARSVALECGKTIREAREEVWFSNIHYRDAAAEVLRHRGSVLPSTASQVANSASDINSSSKRILVTKEPIGVVAVISPWNWPADIPNIGLTFGLAAGNAVILKPSSFTPNTGLLLAEIFEAAGFPRGAINVVTGPGDEVGDALITSPDVGAIVFTGSVEVGEMITQKAGIKKLLLELGGNGPIVVMDDANIDHAVEASAIGAYYLAGQCCTAAERILVQESVHDKFVQKLVERTKRVVMGNPMSETTDMGPLNNEPSAKKVDQHVNDARARGAKILVGGKRERLFHEPTVIDEVAPDMLVFQEETFGPVAPVTTFSTMDEAIELANATPYGLTAAAFTSSLRRAFLLAEGIKAGTVNINETTNYWEQQAPFGGNKKSGLGRELSNWIMDDLTDTKTITFDIDKVSDG
jgi:acyl-CoA reductase-like NAD-dependent aldehyde dehydrogenase